MLRYTNKSPWARVLRREKKKKILQNVLVCFALLQYKMNPKVLDSCIRQSVTPSSDMWDTNNSAICAGHPVDMCGASLSNQNQIKKKGFVATSEENRSTGE